MYRVVSSGARSSALAGALAGSRARVLQHSPVTRAPWQTLRFYAADNRGPAGTVLPNTQSKDVEAKPPVPLVGVKPPEISPTNVPKVPPTPQEVKSIPPAATPPPPPAAATPPPPPPVATLPPPRKRRRFRRYFLLSIFSLITAYAGGVYYSLTSDGFHDFFTEYAPWGEEAVLFFEEREFKRRFPDGVGASTRLYPQVSGEKKVTIKGGSGASARPSSAVSATSARKTEPAKSEGKQEKPKAERPKETPQEKPREKPQEKPAEEAATLLANATSAVAPAQESTKQIDALNVDNAEDPVVQKLVKMLNDVILTVNAANASGQFTSAIEKAKEDLQVVAKDLGDYRSSQAQLAADKIKANDAEFEKAARDILTRVQQEQKAQEVHWREEYEAERARISQLYEDKVKAEIEAVQKVADQKLRNELIEQHIKLQDAFADTIRSQVENERNGRLSKLGELSTTVAELESLTGKWNEVVDATLKTQRLVVAVDAVRTALNAADRPTPFLHELVALKESAGENGVVNAAIASIHPSSYQRGIPTGAQLIDRFRRVATEVRKASLLPEDAGIASHATSFFLSKLVVNKQGLPEGEDVESILTRTETLLEEGDLDEAAREINSLTGWARVLSQDWLTDCRRVLEVKQALEVISTEAKLQSLLVE